MFDIALIFDAFASDRQHGTASFISNKYHRFNEEQVHGTQKLSSIHQAMSLISASQPTARVWGGQLMSSQDPS